MTFLCLYISRWWRQTWDTAPYFTVVIQSEARISTEHGIKIHIVIRVIIGWKCRNDTRWECSSPSIVTLWLKHTYEWLSLCQGNLPVTGGFPWQSLSNVKRWCFLCGWPVVIEPTAEKPLKSPWDVTVSVVVMMRINIAPFPCDMKYDNTIRIFGAVLEIADTARIKALCNGIWNLCTIYQISTNSCAFLSKISHRQFQNWFQLKGNY